MSPEQLKADSSKPYASKQGLDLIGFFALCDRIRSHLEVAQDRPLFKAKQAWLRILQYLSDQQNLETVEVWQQRRNSLDSLLKQLRVKPEFKHLTEISDWDLLVKNFDHEFSKLTGPERMATRKLMIENIAYMEDVFEEEIDTTLLRELTQTNIIERMLSSKHWIRFIQVMISLHFLGSFIYGVEEIRSYAGKSGELTMMVFNWIFLSLYIFELSSTLFVIRKIFFRSFWNRYNFAIVLISLISMILLYFDRAIEVFTLPVLKAGVSLMVFRIFYVFSTAIEKSQTKGTTFETYQNIKNMMFNLLKISTMIFIVLGCIVYAFSITGMELFGCQSFASEDKSPTSFDTFPASLLALFQLATTSNWQDVSCLGFVPDPAGDVRCSESLFDLGSALLCLVLLHRGDRDSQPVRGTGGGGSPQHLRLTQAGQGRGVLPGP
jgi:hypothetical protein